MRLALLTPDIPQNAGALLRLGACLGVAVDVIEPCGFALSDRRMRRAGLDYIARANWRRHDSWAAYLDWRRADGGKDGDDAARGPAAGRLVLLDPAGETPYTDFAFAPHDTLMVGPESAGAPDAARAAADARVRIPMRADLRSLNVAQAAAMVLGEALRQTGGFPS